MLKAIKILAKRYDQWLIAHKRFKKKGSMDIGTQWSRLYSILKIIDLSEDRIYPDIGSDLASIRVSFLDAIEQLLL